MVPNLPEVEGPILQVEVVLSDPNHQGGDFSEPSLEAVALWGPSLQATGDL